MLGACTIKPLRMDFQIGNDGNFITKGVGTEGVLQSGLGRENH
jgi:hypothetical protein